MNGPNIRTGNIDAQGNVILGHNNHVTNIYLSADWQGLKSRHDTLLARIRKYPEDTEFQRELAVVLREMEDFKRDVLKLAEDFQRIPLNTERLQRAQQHFQAGDYAAARAVLDAEAMGKEQDALLARQQQLAAEQTDIQANLEAKANEFLLLAQLTAVDHSLGDQRIARTCGYFEQVLKSGRTVERLFYYARFLQDNNQYQLAEELYSEALGHFRTLAAQNPTVYRPSVATTLNNLASVIAKESSRSREAEVLFTEALDIFDMLDADNQPVHSPDMASAQNNLANLLAKGGGQRRKAEDLYTKSLNLRRILAAQNKEVYLKDVATSLNNLANLSAQDDGQHNKAEAYYKEALSHFRTLADDDLAACTLNNLAALVAKDSSRSSEANAFFAQALTLLRALAIDNPVVHRPSLARTLASFGQARFTWGEPEKARILLEEAAELIKPFAEQHPGVFGPLRDFVAELLCEIRSASPLTATYPASDPPD